MAKYSIKQRLVLSEELLEILKRKIGRNEELLRLINEVEEHLELIKSQYDQEKEHKIPSLEDKS